MGTENWVECTDDYDDDVNDEVWCGGDCGAVDEWTVGTYAITYGVTDVNGNSATTITRYVYVEDTTDPVMYNYGADSVMMEASNPEQYTWTIGAKCTDTCLALTSQGKVDTTALGYSPDDSDLQQWIEYDIAVVAYADHSEYTNDWEASLEWSFCTDETGCTYMGDDLANFVIDEQQYYCGSDGTTDMDTYAEYAMDALPEGGDKDVGNYLQELSSACGLYVVTYSCEDQVGNTATATQHIFVRDTIDPAIYTGYYLFSSMSGATGGVFLGGLCVAFVVGLVAHRQKRSAYIPL